ncbi:hypothetical protein, partial [Acinetobacter baumannii]|uniref:hypothetical protein n=1 Tax=Acinetobacter baumannii TaxID=470 RepID=UPI00232F81F0
AEEAGAVDESFGLGGVATFDLTPGNDYASGCAVAANGDVLTLVNLNGGMGLAVLRLDDHGALVDGFGDAGVAEVATLAVNSSFDGNIIERADGSILAAYVDGTVAKVTGLEATGDRLADFGQADETASLQPGGAALFVSMTQDGAGAAFVTVGL